MSISDSKEHELTQNGYLLGCTLMSDFGKLFSYFVESINREDKLGKWNAIELRHDKKMIIVINLHRFPYWSRKGDTTSLSQHKRTIGA